MNEPEKVEHESIGPAAASQSQSQSSSSESESKSKSRSKSKKPRSKSNSSKPSKPNIGQKPAKENPARKPAVGPPIGIDLGTTYSVVAQLNNAGQPISLTNIEGDLLTPSVLLFDDGEVIVGKEAVKALSTDFDNIIECPKRQMGRRVFNKAIGNRRFPPEVLQAWVLKKVSQDATRTVGEIKDVVITVPAYFDETRRKATQDAGYIAGLNVIGIINEPTAAAIAYGFRQGWLDQSAEFETARTFLVYDLGGGTFDVTVMRVDKTGFCTIATDGDIQLGGRDWDLRLVDYVAEGFLRNFGKDPRDDADALGQLIRDCQEAKESLSVRNQVNIKCTCNGLTIKKSIKKDDFEELTKDLVERTAFTTRQTLKQSGKSWDEIDVVLLVGGSTRMPSIQNMLRELSGKHPRSDISPDEAVAHGAAIQAGILRNQFPDGVPLPKIKNVNSHSLGIVANRIDTGEEKVVRVIPRNSPLPVISSRTFKTHRADQESIKVRIVEGESENPDDCSLIGKCSIWNLPENLPIGTSIEVKFGYQENGRLIVRVKVGGTKKPYRYKIDRPNSLTQEQLDSWRAYIAGESTTRWKAESNDAESPKD